VAVRGFYAQQDARTPLFAAMLTALAFFVFGFFLYRSLGAPGIGLANTLAFSGKHPAALPAQSTGAWVVAGGENAGTQPARWPGWQSGGIGGMAVLGESLISMVIALLAGGAVVLPFIWLRSSC